MYNIEKKGAGNGLKANGVIRSDIHFELFLYEHLEVHTMSRF